VTLTAPTRRLENLTIVIGFQLLNVEIISMHLTVYVGPSSPKALIHLCFDTSESFKASNPIRSLTCKRFGKKINFFHTMAILKECHTN